MNILNPQLLRSIRAAGPCEVCRKWCRLRDGHHAFPRGSGQIDLPINLIAVGAAVPVQCSCHFDIGNGKWLGKVIGAKEVQRKCLEIIAAREGTTVEAIVDEIYRLRQLPQPRDSVDEPVVKRKKVKTAWQIESAKRRRAAAKVAYQRAKEAKKRTKSR